jgi:hypothetical protein
VVAYDDARARTGRPRIRWHRFTAAGVAGAVAITPLAFLLSLGAYAAFDFMVVAWLVGIIYGAIVAGAAIVFRGRVRKHLDRTG